MSKLPDNIVGISSVGAAKQKAVAYTTSILEASSPDLRQILTRHLQDCFNEQNQFSMLAEQRGWYTPNVTPQALVQQAAAQAVPALSAAQQM
jgi:similar to spore coat protein